MLLSTRASTTTTSNTHLAGAVAFVRDTFAAVIISLKAGINRTAAESAQSALGQLRVFAALCKDWLRDRLPFPAQKHKGRRTVLRNPLRIVHLIAIGASQSRPSSSVPSGCMFLYPGLNSRLHGFSCSSKSETEEIDDPSNRYHCESHA